MTVSVWILGDQLLLRHPALLAAEDLVDRQELWVVLIESRQRAQDRPYQRKKLVLLFSAMRHYAQRLRDEGYQVDYLTADSFAAGLEQHVERHGPEKLLTMASGNYGGRRFQEEVLPERLDIAVEIVPNSQFLVEHFNPIADPEPDKHYVMEQFYRAMRERFDVLLDDGQPVGGQWNFDKLNRERLPAEMTVPDPVAFEPDSVTRQVMDDVAAFEKGVGSVAGFNLAVTHAQAREALADFVEHRLESFGPYEDAMTSGHSILFHSVLSPLVNLGLLEPLQMVEAVVAAYEEGQAPINSVEGFVRQVIGWREFMYWQYWRLMPALAGMNGWENERPMPAMFWNGETDMNCIRQVVERATDLGYTHHIERLMIVTNYCTLVGVRPQAVVEWFMTFYIDAYDWVMQPNVIGMGLHADGGLTATKPYISSANYINRMSDYCKACHYDRRQRLGAEACPYNFLYWHFLFKNEERLRQNPRMARSLFGIGRFDEAERQAISEQANQYLDSLRAQDGGE